MSICCMPSDLESWEQQFETKYREKVKYRGRTRARVRPPQARARDRPLRIGGDDPDLSWRPRPDTYPIFPHPRAFRLLLSACEGRTGLFAFKHARRFRSAPIALSAHHRGWLRTPDEWVPPEGDADEQFAGLVRRLFALYDTPRFLDAAWHEGLTPTAVLHQVWFRHIAAGGSIRTVEGLPLPMTRRMAHHFIRAPDDLDIPAALRYAQVLALGGDERLARGLLTTRLGMGFRDNDFWETVIRWFIAHPELDPRHHGPIIDYLHGQKFAPTVANPSTRVRGRPRQSLLVVPQPDLTMKGRTPDALLGAVERWHRRLASERPAISMEWKPSGIAPLVHRVGEGADRRVYETSELICTEELQAEGAAMRHCVATYWNLCATGRSSIWSMTVEDVAGRVDRLLALEVRNGERLIVQARGEANRTPTPEELRVLALWEYSSGPSLSRSLFPEPAIDITPDSE
jgi:hypothetical protein